MEYSTFLNGTSVLYFSLSWLRDYCGKCGGGKIIGAGGGGDKNKMGFSGHNRIVEHMNS